MQERKRSTILRIACALACVSIGLGEVSQTSADQGPMVTTQSQSVRSNIHPCPYSKAGCYSVDTITVERPQAEVGATANVISPNASGSVYPCATHQEYDYFGGWIYTDKMCSEDHFDGTASGLRAIYTNPSCQVNGLALGWSCTTPASTGSFYDPGKGALTNWDN